MPEFLVHFEVTVLPGTRPHDLYQAEWDSAELLIKNGFLRRVWRIPGTLSHWSLWWAPDADFIHNAYASFPLFKENYGRATVYPLATNHNDPGWPGADPRPETVDRVAALIGAQDPTAAVDHTK